MIRRYLLPFGWTIAILAACSIPGNDIPSIGFDLFEADKFVHFFIFFVFGWLWSNALPDAFPGKFFWIGFVGLGYGVFTEIYQGYLPWERTPDPFDAIANLIGLLASIVGHRWKFHRQQL